ncbi:6-phosphogluconate dehydrogenase NAD-binding domain containing protein [Gracilaria domingensis]|nr:6-phosphogluconate dehydrogenase NAD-binding domain containing protein [Gracilaria domingensis]
MGCHMATHVIKAGYTLTVYNRTMSKAQPLIDLGATYVQTPAEVAAVSDVVFTMVGYPSDVRQVISGADGVLSTLKEGGIVVDLTTSDPGLAAELAALAGTSGKFVVDAPVTGGDVGAQKGTLSIMVGGDKQAVKRIKPLLDCFASTVTVFAGPGTGQHCKMANQIAIASSMLGMCEGLMYAHTAGLDLESFLAAIVDGGAGSFSIRSYAPRILKGDMEPGFYVEHFVKDLGIALESCKQMGVCLPGLALAQQLYVSLTSCGDKRLGTQALIKSLERINGRELPTKQSFTAW